MILGIRINEEEWKSNTLQLQQSRRWQRATQPLGF